MTKIYAAIFDIFLALEFSSSKQYTERIFCKVFLMVNSTRHNLIEQSTGLEAFYSRSVHFFIVIDKTVFSFFFFAYKFDLFISRKS